MKDVIKKFRFKAETIVINAPQTIETELMKLGFTNELDKKTKSANTLVFVNNYKEFTSFLNKRLQNLEHDGVLWFAYPKISSGIKTDINRDILRETGLTFGLKTVTAVSMDDTRSALRFRPTDTVGK